MEWARSRWLWEEKCYGRLSRESGEGLVRGVALALTDRVSDALDALASLPSPAPLPTAYALLYAHNQCQVVDSGAVSRLEARIREEKRRAGAEEWYWSGAVNWLTGAGTRVEDCLRRCLTLAPQHSRANALLGWTLLSRDPTAAKAHFLAAQKQDKHNVDAVLGEIACSRGAEEGAVARANQLIVSHPRSALPLLVRARLHLASTRNWDLAQESLDRVLAISPNDIHALHLKALKSVVEGKYEEAAALTERLRKELSEQEPTSWWLPITMSSSLARCSGGHPALLSSTRALAQAGVEAGPYLMEPLLEAAYQAYLDGDLEAARTHYTAATRLDTASVEALVGLTLVQCAQTGLTPQVKQQTDFLMEVGGDESRAKAALVVLRAGLEEGGGGEEERAEVLGRALGRQQEAAARHPYGPEHLAALDPALLLAIARAYPQQCVRERTRVLRLVSETVGGLREGRLELAGCLLEGGEVTEAEDVLQELLDADQSDHRAHLLAARISIDKGEFEKGKASLELSLSYNLGVKEAGGYHLLCALAELGRGSDRPQALDSLRKAIDLHSTGGGRMTTRELARAYRELSSELTKGGRLEEAEEVVKRAEEDLGGTAEDGVAVLAAARLAALKHSPQRALDLLAKIPPDRPHYVEGQMMKAEIYLKEMKDEHAYTDCYRKLTESNPTTENFLMLGDAYLAIQESELAVESYERAMVGSTENPKLSCRLARVLVRCHQYAKAIKCYRDSGEEGSTELAELLLKLGQTDKAEAALADVPLASKVFVLAKVYEKGGRPEEAFRVLKKAEEEAGREPGRSAELNEAMGHYASLSRDFDAAIDCYKKALLRRPHHVPVQIALANLYMQVGDWSGCESVCSSVLSRDEESEEALLMLGDLAVRRVDFPAARGHLTALLAARPTNWVALVRLVQVLRRTAALHDAETYLRSARELQPNAPGLAYATGLYYWYTGRTSEAVEMLNSVRGDGEWGGRAVHDLVEVVLGAGGGGGGGTGGGGVGRLLAELTPATPSEEGRLTLLRAFARLASQDPKQVERATLEFTQLANSEAHRVGATLGLATCYAMQKQATRARTVLKRVAKAGWSWEEAEHLEKAWLLLADLMTTGGGGGRPEAAQEVLARVVRHNRSSARAHELLGLIAEKDHKYYEASRCYEEAWRLGGEGDGGLGYRLAYNLVKSKRYAEAVSVARTVLDAHPDYPRIKKDVLDKALAHLRT